MTDRSFVDTNVWVYAVDANEPKKQARARHILKPDAGEDLVISAQVLGEFFVTVTRKFARSVPEDDARAMVERMARLPVVPIDAGLVTAAMVASREWQISYWDALILSAAEMSGCRTVLSEDLSDGTTYGSVTVVNPFRAD
ncbi:MAG: PIN domain-containing protein [Candidatus Limnocylindrales bacterium]